MGKINKASLNEYLDKPTVKEGVVPRRELFGFSAGIAGQNLSYTFIANWLFYYGTSVLGLVPFVTGTVMGIVRIFDGLNDAGVGVIMDRKRFRNGERLRPYLLFMAPFIGILAALMFINPGLKTDLTKALYFVIIYMVWDIFYTFQDIAQWGMTSLITPVSDERASVAQWARIGAAVGGWLPGLIPIIIDIFAPNLLSEKTLFALFGICFGFSGMIISMFTHKAKERVYAEKPTESVWKSLNLLLKNKTVMLLFLANILKSFAFMVPAIYFFKYKVVINVFGIQINGLTFSVIFSILTNIPGTLAMLIGTKISKIFGGMKNLLIVANVLNIIVRVICFFIGYEGWNMVIVMVLLAFSSIPFGIRDIASTALWGDSIDYMEYKTGKRAEAVTFAAQNLIAKITGGISIFVAGLTLTLLKFDEGLYELGLPQSDTFNKLIWPIFILGEAMASVLFLIPAFFIDYNEKTRMEVDKALRARRAKNEAASAKEAFPDNRIEF